MTKKSLYDEKKHGGIEIHIELSTLCNLQCPVCPRNVKGGLTRPELDQQYMTIDTFKGLFEVEDFQKIRQFTICGTLGDSAANQDLKEICRYIKEAKPNIKIQLVSNGSLRTPDWWSGLAEVLNEHDYVVFSIDGLEDTNHLYRFGANWSKLMSNIKAFRPNFKGVMLWDYLVFEHNEHQIEEARVLAKELGFEEIVLKRPLGFESNFGEVTPIDLRDKNGELLHMIYPSTLKEYQNDQIKAANWEPEKWKSGELKLDQKIDLKRFYSEDALWSMPYREEVNEINCAARNVNNSLYVDVQGRFWPCCWIGELINGRNKLADGKQLLRLLKKDVKTVNKFSDLEKSEDMFRLVQNNLDNKKACENLSVCKRSCGNNNLSGIIIK